MSRFSFFLSTALIAAGLWISPALAKVEYQQGILKEIKAIQSATKADEEKARKLLERANSLTSVRVKLKLASIYYQSGQIEAAQNIYDELMLEFDDFDKELKIRVLVAISSFEKSRNNYIRAEEIAKQQILPLAEPDSPQLGNVYRMLGMYMRYQFKLLEAKYYYEKAIEFYQSTDDENGLADSYGSIGVMYESMGNLAEALKYQQMARVIFEKGDEPGDLATNYFNLGELYLRSEELDKAMEYYLRALELDTQLNNIQDIAYDHHRIATLNIRRQDYDTALQHTQEAIKLLIKQGAEQALSRAYLQQAQVYKLLDDRENRVNSLNLGLEAAERSNIPYQLRAAWHAFGQFYFDVREYTKAETFVKRSLDIATDLSLETHIFEDQKLLAEIYHLLEQDDKAFKHLRLAFEIEQKLNTDQHIKETEKHKRDINLLEEQIKVTKLQQQQAMQSEMLVAERAQNDRNIIVFLSIAAALALISFLLLQRRKWALLKAKLYKDALNQKDQLLADVSHELRTPLTSLKLQVDALQHNIVKDVDASYEKLGAKIMDINRLISDIYELAQSDTGTLKLNKVDCDVAQEFSIWAEELKEFVNAKGFRFESHLDLKELSLQIDPERIKQIVCNLISNSCHYTDKPGLIRLVAQEHNGGLKVLIEDTSPSVEKDQLGKIFTRLYRVEKSRSRQTGGSGLGLSICKSLVELHGGKIRAEQSSIGGLTVYFIIPAEQS